MTNCPSKHTQVALKLVSHNKSGFTEIGRSGPTKLLRPGIGYFVNDSDRRLDLAISFLGRL